MSLDYSGITVNLVHVARIKQRTIRNLLAKYGQEDKPLILEEQYMMDVYVNTEKIASIHRSGKKSGIEFFDETIIPAVTSPAVLMKRKYYAPYLKSWFAHPEQTDDAIRVIMEKWPAFGTWLFFNINDIFKD